MAICAITGEQCSCTGEDDCPHEDFDGVDDDFDDEDEDDASFEMMAANATHVLDGDLHA